MEKLLRKEDIAAMLGTTSGVAASVLEQRGVHPIDWGRGRGRGPRWLASAVEQALREIHMAAQPQPKASRYKSKPSNVVGLANMSVADVLNLTNRPCVQ